MTQKSREELQQELLQVVRTPRAAGNFVSPPKEKPDSLVEEFSSYTYELPYSEKARRLVFNYVSAHLEKTDSHVKLFPTDVYVVWFSKTLQNWKALLSTTLPDGMYYEVTYNGDAKEAYLDAYKKFENVCYPDSRNDSENN